MKIAIAAMGEKIESEISPQAGRAPYYLFFENNQLVETVKNPFASGGGGAGYGVVKLLVKNNVDKVIAGKFGDNMLQALNEAKIEFKERDGVVQELLKKE